jgi:hypothetical protein
VTGLPQGGRAGSASGQGSEPPPTVLFVAGMTRSGSTVLDRVLGDREGFFAAGELHNLWWDLPRGVLCSCGKPLRDCPFWAAVLTEAFGEEPIDWTGILRVKDRYVGSRPWQLLRLRREARGGGGDSPIRRYAELLERLYRAISTVSGAEVIVDASKGPHDLYLIDQFTDLNPYVIHLVRDPRAVAHSWARTRESPADPGGDLDRVNPLISSTRWLVRNSVVEILIRRSLGDRYLRVGYEKFASRPAETAGAIYDFLGRSSQLPQFVGETTVQLGESHAVEGNPALFAKGVAEIRPDLAWSARASRSTRLLATLPALPLIRRYGYQLFPRRTPG